MPNCRNLSPHANGYLESRPPWWKWIYVGLHAFLRRSWKGQRSQLGAVIGPDERTEIACNETGAAEESAHVVRRPVDTSNADGHGGALASRDHSVVIYTKRWCPYCNRAKALLDRKRIPYQEIRIDSNSTLRTQMISRADGRSTVPQVFIDDEAVGGSDDLAALEASGDLDRRLRRL